MLTTVVGGGKRVAAVTARGLKLLLFRIPLMAPIGFLIFGLEMIGKHGQRMWP